MSSPFWVRPTSSAVTTSGEARPHGLARLNYDVLEHIYEHLSSPGDLDSLSLTCKWLRASCRPFLFRYSATRADRLTIEHFLPPQFWHYVHSLTFEGEWVYPNPPYSCYHAISLAEILPLLPCLSRIRVLDGSSNGVPWPALNEILTLRRLRTFEVNDTLHHYSTEIDPPPQEFTSPCAPLSCYRQVLEDYRLPPRIFPSDVDTIAYVASQKQVQQSLEVLVLPSEAAPLAALEDACWPKLKVLGLRGELRRDQPLVHAFERMPALEELRLEVARAKYAGQALVICPTDWPGPSPWPHLKRLVVAYPDPDDPLYSHVSATGTLQLLDLRCWPRHYVHLAVDNRLHMVNLGWRSPILKSSALLRLLSRCQSRSLLELLIEYLEDEDDMMLLGHLPILFPNLRRLTILRYRQPSAADVPIRAIGEALAPLSQLQVLYVHLDLHGAPHPWANDNYRGRKEMARHSQALVEAAQSLAQGLGVSVEAVCLLFRDMRSNFWRHFRVVRTGTVVRASLDASLLQELGLLAEDDRGPPVAYREWESRRMMLPNN